MQFANLTTSLNPLDPDKGGRVRGAGGAGSWGCGEPGVRGAGGVGSWGCGAPSPRSAVVAPCAPDEEEEEEEDSEDDLPQDMALAAGGQSPALGPESLQPPAKLARTDARGLFVPALPTS